MKGRDHRRRIAEIAELTGRPQREIEEVISLFYEGVKVKLTPKPVCSSVTLSEEEFNKHFKSLIIPRLGTYVPNYKKYLSSKKHLNNEKI